MRRMLGFVLAVLSIASCELHVEEPVPAGPQGESVVHVRFSPELSDQTRSSISPDESLIYDLNVYAFRNGVLVDEVYSTSLDNVVMELPIGYSYDIYAVANMGRCPSDAIEERFVEEFEYSIGDLSEINERIPMSCVCRNVNVGQGTKEVRLLMERAVAKVVLSVDKASILKGLQVKSVRLCQSSSVVYPFKWDGQGGSRAESADEVISGDFATEVDLNSLNSGESVVFYALENCQGILLPDNTDPLEKVPYRIGDKETLCTYLEVCAAFGSEGILDGNVNYRIYLGLDSTSSFDVPGNSSINVSLMLTDDGLRDISWKVDADVSVREGYVYGYVSEGMHGMTDLYVGEKVLYELELADDLLEYIKGDLFGCRLEFLENGEVSDGISVNHISADGGILQAELLCRESVEGELVLYGPDGEHLGCVEKRVFVKVPDVVFSEYSVWEESDPVESLTYSPECEINGVPAEFYMYFVDENGCNLNGCQSYGFASELFDIYDVAAESGGEPVNAIRVESTPVNGGLYCEAAAHINVYCDNDGTDHLENVQLSDLYGHGEPVYVEFVDESFGISQSASVKLGIPQMTLTLVDNGWAMYHDCQLSVIVDNPSNLPLHVSAWQLMITNNKYGAVDKTYVENNLILDRMCYMTGEFYNGNPPLYGSKSSFVSERNDYGTVALESGEKLVYPLSGISSDDLNKAIYYDKQGIRQMMHMVDVTSNGSKIRDGDILLEDSVSNGSATYNYIYYSEDSWNYKGAGLSSAGDMVYYSGVWSYDYPNVNALTLDGLYDRYAVGSPVYVTLNYNSSSEKITLLTNSQNALHDFNVSMLYHGQVNGYVQTYPKGTWSDPQDNYCTVDFEHVTTGLPMKVNSTYVWADDGKVKDAIDGIYEFSYKDSPKGLGGNAYMHRAHPVDFDLNVSCAVEGDNKSQLYPIIIDWKFDNIPYYHEQDGINYKCTLNAVSDMFSIVIVSSKM